METNLKTENRKTREPEGPEALIDLLNDVKVGQAQHRLIIQAYFVLIGYNINVLQQTACFVVNPITAGNFAFLFNCTPVGRTSDFFDHFEFKTYLLMRCKGPDALDV